MTPSVWTFNFMPRRTTLSDLSVEIHFEILKYALYSSQSSHSTARRGYLIGRRIPRPIKWKWIEQDRHTLSQFPYNMAAVSRLWYSILTTIPECWTRVIIDVATDPHRFLDIFLWSKDLPKLEVTIFNSQTPDPKDAKHCALERERVSMIVKSLRPHIHRCEYIKFDIAFMTSLPSPVIFLLEDPQDLEELILECKIDNAGPPEEYALGCDLGVCEPISKYPTLPNLDHLSITGFWFMFIAGHSYTQELFKEIEDYILCSVSTFQFQKKGQYTLQNFVSYCSQLEAADLTTLRDLSLDHDGPILEREDYKERAFSEEKLTFKNVSPDVLQTLFFLTNISPRSLTFENCTFPEAILPLRAKELTLKNIPHSTPVYPEATNTINLCSILKDWSGSSLSVKSCPSFDDDALTALSADDENPCLTTLCLSDCNSFTVQGLQRYIQRRNRSRIGVVSMNYLSGGDSGRRPMETIKIDGTGHLFLSEEEEEWFETSVYAERTTITWSGKNFRDQQLNKLLLSTID